MSTLETRETFFKRLEPFLAPSDLIRVQLAYTLAKYGHRAQTRQELGPNDKPLRYFEHPRRVALMVIDQLKILDPDIVIPALLHDGPEDTRDLTIPVIDQVFGSNVARTVKLLTKPTALESFDYKERLRDCRDWRVLTVKACDRMDNLLSLVGSSPTFWEKQRRETYMHYIPLFLSGQTWLPAVHQKSFSTLIEAMQQKLEDIRACEPESLRGVMYSLLNVDHVENGEALRLAQFAAKCPEGVFEQKIRDITTHMNCPNLPLDEIGHLTPQQFVLYLQDLVLSRLPASFSP